MTATHLPSRAALALAFALLALGAAPPVDVFDFIPAGGRTLLLKVLGAGAPAAEARALLSARRTRAEWLAHLRERAGALPGLKGLGDKEFLTLADYLAFNMPLPAARVPATPTPANLEKVLPVDGRDMALEYCQNCHIITVVVTQDRTREAWLGTLSKPSHVEVKITRQQREALASYLVLNAAIPIDLVPEELRAGGATY